VSTSTRTSLVNDIAASIAVALGYFAMCWLGLALDVTAGVGSVWPASGLLTGILMLAPRHRWVAIASGAFIGGVAANLAVGFSFVTSLGYVLVNLGESFVANWLMRRYAPDAVRLRQPSDVFALIGYVALVAVSAGAPIAAALASLTSNAHFWTVLRTWWTADVSGAILIAPVILASCRRSDRHRQPTWAPSRVIEGATMLASAAIASWWIFLVPHGSPGLLEQPFPLIAFFVWAAIRFGVLGSAWTMLVISGFCIWGTHIGFGPYATADTLLAHLSVQAFACMVSIVSLSLATAVESATRSAMLHRELALTLQSAVEAERARLSHELHDDIAQKLAALKMQLELDQLLGQNRQTSTDSVAAVDGLIGNVRELSRSLRPAPFEEGQLIPALATLAKTEGRRAGLRVLIDAPADEVPLSREAELACYRVVREAVINIVKHARAHHLAVSALTHANFFSVRIVDDGTGFDVAPAARQAVLDGHLGLMGMQERLEQVGGTLRIRSRRGGGTMVECRVPLVAIV
jgi:glucose-6-phosphate-specific signal transduction histidine kinase